MVVVISIGRDVNNINDVIMKKEEYKNEAYVITDEKTDYLNYVTRSSTKEQRRKFGIGDIFINAAVCLNCKDYIRSTHRHDFVSCSCFKNEEDNKGVAVDGGSWYGKALGDEKNYIRVYELFYDGDKNIN